MTFDEFITFIRNNPNHLFCCQDAQCNGGVLGRNIVAVRTNYDFAYIRPVHRTNGLEVWVKAPGHANGLCRNVPNRPDKLVLIYGGTPPPPPPNWVSYPRAGIQVDEGVLKIDETHSGCIFNAEDGTTIAYHMAFLA
jgi:hypothetical protein